MVMADYRLILAKALPLIPFGTREIESDSRQSRTSFSDDIHRMHTIIQNEVLLSIDAKRK